ncbi:hypothetical protein [Chitinophaga sp. S165]|uniref:hypothetical protein n=1 Tax=Chitinophaga sp. S165 TaxID=2135462 RepID=UPI000D70D7D6|nr:hypothetical protein [Chitinophaga sp. S165]PWV56607.1 hypothetical protein C7475_1011124 [Chitinophaga sp. S165]
MHTLTPEVKSNEFTYSLKTWLTIVALGPIVYRIALLSEYSFPDFEVLITEFYYMFFVGLLYSCPSFVLSYGIVKLVNKLKRSMVVKKCILLVPGILVTTLAVYLFDNLCHIFDLRMDRVWTCYLISTIGAIWIYKLHPIVKKSKGTNSTDPARSQTC